MGKFACHCGYVISDAVYPCPAAGELRWEPEIERQDPEVQQMVSDFLSALERNEKEIWIRNCFGKEYPSDLSPETVIDDIYSKAHDKNSRAVYQCPECERLYVQKE